METKSRSANYPVERVGLRAGRISDYPLKPLRLGGNNVFKKGNDEKQKKIW